MNINSALKFLREFFTRRKLIILVIFILLASGGFVFAQRSRQKPIEYTEVKKQDIISTVSASGTLNGKNTANLHFKGSGKLAYLNIKTGDQVFAGQIIAGLDSQDLAVNLQVAQNNLRDKQATLDKILDDIHLFQYGNGSTIGETEAQRATRTTAEVAKDNAYDSVRTAQRAFEDTTLISPIAGIVTKADFLAGQVVSPTDIIAQVIDDKELYFDSEVDESDISKITLGQQAIITLNTHPDKKFPGAVFEIKPITKTATSGATVVIVRILLDSTNITFIANLNGQAEIGVDKAKAVLSIPQDSLVDEKYVYIQDGKGYKKIAVKTGIQSDTEIEIKEGLSENQKVVKNPGNIPGK